MNLERFELERWLQVPNELDIASAGITKLKLRDITDTLDPDMIMNYGITCGSDDIRQQIADLYTGVGIENVLVTNGTAEANLLTLFRLLEPGDECVVFLPSYMQCAGLARSLRALVRPCGFLESEGNRPDLETLKDLVNSKTKVVCCVNPNNPTGSIITPDEMKQICSIADAVGAWVLCDGALRGLELQDQPAPTPVESYERGIATGSLSKVGITGIRIGWMVANPKLIDKCWADKDYTTLSHSGIGEYLAGLALRPDNYRRYVKRGKDIIASQTAVLGDWIEENGDLVSWVPSRAGHTAFIGYTADMDAEELARRLLDEEGVLVAPGDYFGLARHLRIRYSGERDELVEALRRFAGYLKRQ